MNNKDRKAIADKMKQIAKDIQLFIDSVSLSSAESEEMGTLISVQGELCDAFEELTGKQVF